MLPWKRRELYVGNSLQEPDRIRDILDVNHVPHDFRTGGDTVSTRNMPPRTEVMGRWGTNPELSVEYKIYVAKEQFEYAMHLISGQN